MNNNPEIWGPYYWFFLHTIAINYPDKPNDITKRKYYDLIQNMPLFIPTLEIGNKFAELLDKYPVSPYLCSRQSFMKWVHFIHNKINFSIGKKEMSYLESLEHYNSLYKDKTTKIHEQISAYYKYIYIIIISICLFLIYLYY